MNMYSVLYGEVTWLAHGKEKGTYTLSSNKERRALFYTRTSAMKAIRDHADSLSVHLPLAQEIIISYFTVTTERFVVDMDDVLITHPIREPKK